MTRLNDIAERHYGWVCAALMIIVTVILLGDPQ